MSLADKLARPTGQCDAENLPDGTTTIDEATRGGGAFFRAEINRRRTAEKRVRDEDEKANYEHPGTDCQTGMGKKSKGDHRQRRAEQRHHAYGHALGLEKAVGYNSARQRADRSRQIEHASEKSRTRRARAKQFVDVHGRQVRMR